MSTASRAIASRRSGLLVAAALAFGALLLFGQGPATAEIRAPDAGAQFLAGEEIVFVVRGGGPSPGNPYFVPDPISVVISSVAIAPDQLVFYPGFEGVKIQASYTGPVQGGGGGLYMARWTPSVNQAPGTYWWQAQNGFNVVDTTRTLTLLPHPAGVPLPRGISPADGTTIVAGPNVTFAVESGALPSPFLDVRVSRSPALAPDGTLATVSEPGLPYGIQVGERTVAGSISDLWQAGTFWFTSAGGRYIPAGTYYWQAVLKGPIPLDADRQVAGPVYSFTLTHPPASSTTPAAALPGTPKPSSTPAVTTTTADPRCGAWRRQLRAFSPKLKVARRLVAKAPNQIARRRAQKRVRTLVISRARLATQLAKRC